MGNGKTFDRHNAVSLKRFYLLLILTYLLCDWTLWFVWVFMEWPLRTACLIVLWGLSHFWLLSSLSILESSNISFYFTLFLNFNWIIPFITSEYEFFLRCFDQLRTLFEIIVIVLIYFVYFLTNERSSRNLDLTWIEI